MKDSIASIELFYEFRNITISEYKYMSIEVYNCLWVEGIFQNFWIEIISIEFE